MTDLHPWVTTKLQPPPESSILFRLPPHPTEVIRLDKEGFHYRGQFIADAGEAHRLMVEFLRQGTVHAQAAQPVGPTDEELHQLEEMLWDRYKTLGFQSEEFMYDHSFGFALADFARAVLARWGRS